ncbi:MAG: hypothetical protein AAGE52_21855 [Myxococcota bacterium]
MTLIFLGGCSDDDGSPQPDTGAPDASLPDSASADSSVDEDAATDEVAGAIFALTNRHNPSAQISAADDAADEDLENEVVSYARMADGSLVQVGVFPTGGVGENIRNSGANPLASQDPLILSEDQRFLFAVNAGSETVTSFRVMDDASLEQASVVGTSGASDAQNPVSLTIRGNILYVANSGAFFDDAGAELTALPDDRNRTQASLLGFTVADDGSLTELADSELPGIGANVGSVEFSTSGRQLYVTQRRTNDIIAVQLNEDGTPARDASGAPMMQSLTANTPQPFGTDILSTADGETLLVSEGNNGEEGLSALSSYRVEDDGSLTVVSASSGTEGDPLVTGFTFGCWVEIAQGPEGNFAYVANTPDGTLTSYTLAPDGSITRLASEAANAGIEADENLNGAGVLDTEIVWPFLYQVVNVDSRIAQWQISPDGSLQRQQDLEIVDTELFRPRMFVGIAGF